MKSCLFKKSLAIVGFLSLLLIIGATWSYAKDKTSNQEKSTLKDQYRNLDLSRLTCPTVKSFRQKLKESYDYNITLVEQNLKEAKAYFDERLKQCVSNSQQSQGSENCDKEWENVQNSYQQAIQNFSDKAMYGKYQKAKTDWETCHKKIENERKKKNDLPKEWECHEIYEFAMGRAKESASREFSWLKNKYNKDVNTLDEFEKKCAANENKNGNSIGTDTTTNPPEGGFYHIDISKTTCPQIPQAKTAVNEAYSKNLKTAEEIRDFGKAVFDVALKECMKTAKTTEDKNFCNNKYKESIKEVMDDYTQIVKEETTIRDEAIKFLNDLEKKCTRPKKEEPGNTEGGQTPKEKPPVDVSKASCKTIVLFRKEVKEQYLQETQSAKKTYQEVGDLLKTILKNCQAKSKTKAEKATCQKEYQEELQELKNVHNQDLKDSKDRYDSNLKTLSDLEKKCKEKEPAKTKVNKITLDFPENARQQAKDYTTPKATCKNAVFIREELRSTHTDNYNLVNRLHSEVVENVTRERDVCSTKTQDENEKSACNLKHWEATGKYSKAKDQLFNELTKKYEEKLKVIDGVELKCGN